MCACRQLAGSTCIPHVLILHSAQPRRDEHVHAVSVGAAWHDEHTYCIFLSNSLQPLLSSLKPFGLSLVRGPALAVRMRMLRDCQAIRGNCDTLNSI